MLFEASDIFSLSIQSIGWIYFSSFVLPAVANAAILSDEGGEKVFKLANIVLKPNSNRKNVILFGARWLVALFNMLMILMLAESVYGILNDEIFLYGGLTIASVVGFMLYGMPYLERRGISTIRAGLIWLSFNLALTAFTSGAGAGQADRRSSYSALKDSSAMCGNYLIRRRAGDLFIAVGRDNKRLIIDDDCKEKMTFVRRKTFSTKESFNFYQWTDRGIAQASDGLGRAFNDVLSKFNSHS